MRWGLIIFETMRSHLRRALSITLVAALLSSSLPAQTPSPQAQKPRGFTFKVQSELVLVNVVARDKQGNLVQDLKMQDFTLLEDGKPQEISSFDSENLDTV